MARWAGGLPAAPKEAEMDHAHHRGPREHGHSHGAVDPAFASTGRGLWALEWSCGALADVQAGERHHRLGPYDHDDLPIHVHD